MNSSYRHGYQGSLCFTSTPSRIDQHFLGNIGRACVEIRGSKIISVTEIGICEPGTFLASPLECRHIVPRPTSRVASGACYPRSSGFGAQSNL
ncbi:Uncharacterized protein HZ326_31800, partial [Fusarium oxysporum f. sp. albedinis]